MLMGVIWTVMIVISVLFGCASGTAREVAAAALDGGRAAFELCLAIGGAVCLWCAVMELMRASGLADASNELCRLVVLNTASIQLLPVNIAAIRASCGAEAPFDILPAVWISSAVSLAVGLAAAKLMERTL